jgi:putative endonuclease
LVEGTGLALSYDRASRRMAGRKPMSMFYIYILLLNDGDFYTGFSSDLKQRIPQHERGGVESTRYKRPVKLVHYEAYVKESDARRREKFLKTTEGKRFLRMQLRDLLTSLGK